MSEPSEADAIMIRRVARQLVKEIKAEEDSERRKWFGVAPAWFGVAALIVGPLVGGGALYAKIDHTAEQAEENKRAITAAVAANQQTRDEVAAMRETLGRVDENVKFMREERRR